MSCHVTLHTNSSPYGMVGCGTALRTAGMVFNYRCGRKGHCREYDHDGLAQVVVGVFVTCKFITMVCFFLSWFFCRRLQATEKMRDVNNERERQREGGEGAPGASEKELFYNIETAI